MKAASNIEVKKINRNRVFRCINSQKKISRPEIASRLGLSGPTVLQIVNELVAEGLVAEVGEFKSTGGRKAKAVAPVHNAYYAVGLDITRNHISLVLTDLSCRLLQHERIYKPFADEDGYYRELNTMVQDFIRRSDIDPDKILGVGLSIPGIVNPEKEYLKYSHVLNMSEVSGKKFSKYITFPCAQMNDANAAGLAECSGQENNQAVAYLYLSNTVGGAILSGSNSVYYGSHFRGAEFGHMVMVPDGRPCYCGKNGCLDTYISAAQLARHAEGSLEKFFVRLADGESRLKKVWEEYLDYLAIGVHNLWMALDCDVIIGGYVGSFMDPYIDDLRRRVAERDPFDSHGDYVRVCRYQVEASALGAAIHFIERYVAEI